MSAQLEFYRQRAAEAQAVADKSTLDNVRERWLRSAASWTEMAQRSERVATMHARLTEEKAELRAAAKAAEVLKIAEPI
jgi:hypothetical protein